MITMYFSSDKGPHWARAQGLCLDQLKPLASCVSLTFGKGDVITPPLLHGCLCGEELQKEQVNERTVFRVSSECLRKHADRDKQLPVRLGPELSRDL